ncbi:MAG: hypothetical protein AB1798_20460, partial [Spirochaetota bacterium]
MKTKLFFSVFIFLLLYNLHPQQQTVFAPFVSRLKATITDSSIKLTWQDSTDIDGKYFIYRHTEEIKEENFSKAVRLAEVPKGQEAYVDIPPDTQTYYYAVIGQDSSAKSYELFIPFRNKTITGVALKTLVKEEELVAKITDIRTQVQGDAILLTYSVSKEDRDVVIYRSTSPIRSQT